MHKYDTAQSECPASDSDRSEGAGVVLTWFPATEVESQPVCELVLDLHQPLCQLVVPPLPAHTQGQGQSVTHRNAHTNTFSTSQHCSVWCINPSQIQPSPTPLPQPISAVWAIPTAIPELTLTPGA